MKSVWMPLTGTVVLALSLGPPALAERGQGSYYAPPSFNDLDESRTGALDKGEVQGRSPLYGQWDRFDTNRDGLIEPSEFAAFEAEQEAIERQEAMKPAAPPMKQGPDAP